MNVIVCTYYLAKMIVFSNICLTTFSCFISIANAQQDEWFKNILGKEYKPMKEQKKDLYFVEKIIDQEETVDLRLYYESYCPGCKELDSTEFKSVVTALNRNLEIETYPYGNAQMIKKNGKVEFICQHGPGECYGNKLHACALKHILNRTEALLFNICMMEPNNKTKGSDDEAVAKCANVMKVNKGPILECAKGEEGIKLLTYYGEESKKANFPYVPYVLINGVEWHGDDLMHDVCAAFKNPPAACQHTTADFESAPRHRSYCFKINSQNE